MKTNRRKFIATTVTMIGGIPFSGISVAKNIFKSVTFGILADSHYAEREPLNNRYYNESVEKMSECIDLMNEQNVDFLIELGDFKDQGNPPAEEETLRFLDKIEKEFSRFKGALYHVPGNHDHDSISKQQFLDRISNTGFVKASAYYSFNVNSFHFVVLDANYSSQGIPYNHGNFDWTDAYVPDEQLIWLNKDLRRNKMPTIVFIHHRLDITSENKHYGAVNADAVRKILEDCRNVRVVFQGHDHKGGLTRINNINYCTLKAMVEGTGPENNNYAIVEIRQDQIIRIKGFRKTISQELS